jgi:hypothetical protein
VFGVAVSDWMTLQHGGIQLFGYVPTLPVHCSISALSTVLLACDRQIGIGNVTCALSKVCRLPETALVLAAAAQVYSHCTVTAHLAGKQAVQASMLNRACSVTQQLLCCAQHICICTGGGRSALLLCVPPIAF